MSASSVVTGAFASVRVEAADDGQLVAIKTYMHVVYEPGSEKQRMQEIHLANEMHLVDQLQHEHIIAPHSIRVLADRTEFTMEYAPNGSLQDHVRRTAAAGRCMPHAEGQRLFAQVCSAVSYLHSRRIAHRDIKLENVVLDARWNARLIDFGAAEHVAGGQRLSALQGTPASMAPEVLRAAAAKTGDFDPFAADIWALGISLYSLFNGSAIPFTGADIHELIRNVTTAAVPRCPEMPGGARELMSRLLAKVPGARPSASLVLRHPWIDSSSSTRATAGGVAAAMASSAPRSRYDLGVTSSLPRSQQSTLRSTSIFRPSSAQSRPPTGGALSAHPLPQRSTAQRAHPEVESPRGTPAATLAQFGNLDLGKDAGDTGNAGKVRHPPPSFNGNLPAPRRPASSHVRAGQAGAFDSCDFCASMSCRTLPGL